MSNSVSLNPNQTGLSSQSKDRGGWISPKGLMRSYAHIFHQNSPKMVSNDIWHLHFSMESLKTTLWFRIFPQCGSKVTLSQGANFSAFSTQILKIYNFWPIWTIYTSNESWNYFILIFYKKKYSLIYKILWKLNFSKFLIQI